LDGIFILLIVFLNAFFGVYQEFKAEKALSYLKKITVTTIRVIRDGRQEQIDSRDLVPGDLIYLEEGTKIPADCQLVESYNLEINEASLTGESLPVAKDPKDKEKSQLFMGTVVAKGRGYAKVLKTGVETKFGRIAKTLTSIEESKTPLQRKLDVFTKQVGLIGIAASLTVFLLSFIREKNFIESFIFSISLAVAAVPEGLPAVMTITLAIGVEAMAKKKAIVRKLNAIEALGSITLIATDKTGTLTTNKMRVKKIFVDGKIYEVPHYPSLSNQAFSQLVLNGVLCSTASLVEKIDGGSFDVVGDATEGALLVMAQKVGLIPDLIREKWVLKKEFSFDSKTKRMTVVVDDGKEELVFTKGAPESILSICSDIIIGGKVMPLDFKRKSQIESEFEHFARKGLRMIAFSYKRKDGKDLEKNQLFLGFVGIADPIREEVRQAVMKAKEAGIKVVMITGDNHLTAEAVGIEAGIIEEGDDIMIGKQLDDYSDKELLSIIPRVKVFARTNPEHKYRLVKLFQKMGEVVAVTGDGVNDALALKQADVSVAMGITGTDVAKETAHVIITDDNFATLVSAVEEGRNIFNHIKNAIKYLLACNVGEVIYILSAVIFKLPILTPLQLLYINLVTDGLPAIALAFAPNDGNIMREKPKRIMAVLEKKDFTYVFNIGLLTAILAMVSLALPFVFRQQVLTGTILFTTIVVVQQFILIDLWLSHRQIINHLHLLKKPIFLAAFLFPFILHPFLIYSPFFQKVFNLKALDFADFLWSILVAFLILIFIEFLKIKKRKIVSK
ncbi:MAG: cation-translocating P-type ATPase, partial [Microgenomates group bacterium]